MDKDTRALLQRATHAARRALEDELRAQLEGVYDIRPDGTVAAEAGRHLNEDGPALRARAKLVAAVEHHRASGRRPAEAVAALLRECAFTTLNRLVALKMLEAREIAQPCVSQGPLSSGFKQFCGLAPGLVDLPDQGYRLYLDSLFDEIGREVRVLFDRRDPASLLWPRKTALDELLGLLNDPALAGVWGEDETIGWVYQYFNGEDERRQMRAESQAPRNSRELAVRNQFFTPRYVVKFLTDNTLGRTWVEQRRGDTRLVETCRYLVRRPGEGFGASGEAAEHSSTTPSPVRQLAEHPSTSPNPARHLAEHSSTSPSPARHLAEHSSTSPNPSRQSAEPSSTTPSPSRQSAEPSSTAPTPPSPVAFRAKKDPRDLRVLDPACGSGHFLLYSFDLLLVIYEEAWADADSPASEATGHTLVADYPSLDALRRALPGLVLRHNLYGVDIDPRAAQIAAFALWMRAQRAWNALGLKRADRPLVTRTNVVVAEPMPGEPDLLTELCQRLDKPVADIVRAVFVEMKLAGEAGMLLRVEDTVRRGVERLTELGGLYADQDARRWERLEAKVYDALRDYAESVGGVGYRRRLFADDAAQGFAFIELCRQTYDVVLMNPPFGEASVNSRPVIADQYLEWNSNILCAFVIAGIRMCGEDGTIGAVLDQTALVKSTYQEFRRTTMLSRECSGIVVGLGWGVLDASVEVSALCLRSGQGKPFLINSLSHTMSSEHPTELQSRCHTTTGWHEFEAELIGRLPNSALPLSMPPWLIPAFVSLPTFSEICGTAVQGHSLRSAEHFRAFWEVAPNQEISASGPYSTLYNGGEHSYYASPLRDICRYRIKGGGLYSEHVVLRNLSLQGQPGIGWGKRGDYLDAHIMPRGSIFTVEGQGLPSPMRPWLALALLNSTVASLLLSQYCGQHKYSGYVNLCPTPALDDSTRATIEELAFEAWQHVANAWSSDETTPYFNGLNLSDFDSPTQWAHRRASESAMLAQATHVARQKIERCLHLAYGLDSSATDAIREWAVSEPKILNTGPWADGSTEPAWWLRRLISALLGRALGGMSDAQLMQAPQRLTCERAFASVEYHRDDSTQHTNAYLVDDPGHPDDIELAISKVLRFDGESDPATTAAISLGYATLRDYLRNRMFEDHLLAFQGGRRPAPIYWRLGTPSGAYSVWVYLHRVGPDTLHAALRDHVAPKLRYEENSLGRLTAEAGPTPSTAQRRELATQEGFVEELRAFRDELARVAPLWSPNLDDGVVINASFLHRLFQHTRPWAKECEAHWEKLKAGEYDWSQLAMRLWPERVVRKCAEDRSLAIAHGVEDRLWVDDGGRWRPKPVTDEELTELVQARSSAAIREALREVSAAAPPARGQRAPRPAQAAAPKERPTKVATVQLPLDLSAARPGAEKPALDALRMALHQHPEGANKAELLAASGLDEGQWAVAISALVASGEVERRGQARGMRYVGSKQGSQND